MTNIRRRNPTLRLSLALVFTALVVVTSAILGTASYLSARQFVRSGIRDRLRDAVSVGSALIDVEAHSRLRKPADETTADYEKLRQTLRLIRARCPQVRFVYTMRQTPEGTFAFVVDGEEDATQISHLGEIYDGEVSPDMVAAFKAPFMPQVDQRFYRDQYGLWLSSYAPLIAADGSLEGILGMDMAADNIVRYEKTSLMIIPALTLFICVVAISVGIWLSRRISRPLLALAEDMGKVQQFNLASASPPDSRIKEVVEMHAALEHMKGGLRSFRRYVPAELVSNLMRLGKEARLGSEKTEITLFFSDIRDFTRISEKLPPEALSANLAIYFRGMTSAILANRGTVDKYIGDAIMAFWGAPEPEPLHPLLACQAALACQQFLKEQRQHWQAAGLPDFDTRIGIHTGVAMVGNVGFEERLDYTAIGDSVNAASRIEGVNKRYGTRILISETTYSQVESSFSARWVDRIAVMGKASGIEIYELLAANDDATDTHKAVIALAQAARDAYLGRDWDGAIAQWEQLLRTLPGDQAAKILLDRCRSYRESPPPQGWQGVYEMTEK